MVTEANIYHKLMSFVSFHTISILHIHCPQTYHNNFKICTFCQTCPAIYASCNLKKRVLKFANRWLICSCTGLSHTPRSDKSELSFNPYELETYLPHTKALREFLSKYEDDAQTDPLKFENCGGRFFHFTHTCTRQMNLHLCF